MSDLVLIPSTDAHFAWMLDEASAPDGLQRSPGRVDEPWVLKWLRRTLPRLGGRGGYLMVVDGEVVGMISYKVPPNAEREVEIGYGVAADRRRRGHATRAVALLIEAARDDDRVDALVAETTLANLPSQRALEANGFRQTGRGMDDDEGEVIVWRLDL
ncbi:MAG TPA: GNAT family N-acetyltransferase [Caulobacteraceae bacterium]|jgi:RimJ/RimL family protein N-acetyltransferase